MTQPSGAPPGPATAGPPVSVTVRTDPATRPGAVLAVTVRMRAARDVVLQGGQVTLTRALSYRYTLGGAFGTTYTGVARESDDVAHVMLPGPTLLRAGKEVTEQVLFPVPADAAPSTECTLVTIEWSVGARVRFEGTGTADGTPARIALLGEGTGADLSGPTVMPRGRFGTIEVEDLSSRRIWPGAHVSGWVVLRPRWPAAVRGVRLELVLAQVVPHGPLLGDDPSRNPYIAEKEAETVVARVDLGAPIDAGGGQLRAPFVLPVPDPLPAPTLVTPQFSLRWYLRVRVGRRALLGRLTVTTSADLEVAGATAAPPTAPRT